MKKTILVFTFLTLISTAFSAETKTSYETSKEQRLEEMMRRYQGE